MSDLVLYTHPQSRGRIARWMLEEVGQPYEVKVIEYGPRPAEFLAVNPMGKLPTLKHGAAVVTETAAVCAYLADAFPDAGLAPAAGSPERAAYYRWLFFAAGPLEQAVVARSMSWQAPPEREGMLGFGNYERTLGAVEAAVDGRAYVAGDRFTAADVYLGAHLAWGMQFGTIEKRPAFAAYVSRLASRPAAVRANQLDDELATQMAARG
ncbi:glutathione S-transferase family protein [Phenylobacterium sp.]|jgi:glutathione S-transferase|uniref:glutathione S-transferase family protein n=1 Tax=Phenylobacterium sp. TaxID=1871053 RepID=UPI0037840E59